MLMTRFAHLSDRLMNMILIQEDGSFRARAARGNLPDKQKALGQTTKVHIECSTSKFLYCFEEVIPREKKKTEVRSTHIDVKLHGVQELV